MTPHPHTLLCQLAAQWTLPFTSLFIRMSVLLQREFLCALRLRVIGELLWEGSVGLLKASGAGISSFYLSV